MNVLYLDNMYQITLELLSQAKFATLAFSFAIFDFCKHKHSNLNIQKTVYNQSSQEFLV